MKYAVFILSICLLFSFTSKKEGNKDFRILTAEKQTAYGGVAGSGVTTVYRLKVKALRSFKLFADSGWAEGKKDACTIDLDSFKTATVKQVKKGEIIFMHIQIRSETTIGGGDYQVHIPGSREAKSPLDVKNGLVIHYKGGKSKYLIFRNIKINETIYAP